jgi:hypothetical protein
VKRPGPGRKIKPEFTEAQAGMIRFALKEVGEYELDAPSHKAARNALKELDRAQREAKS